MTPRSDVVRISGGAVLDAETLASLLAANFSRVLVWTGDVRRPTCASGHQACTLTPAPRLR